MFPKFTQCFIYRKGNKPFHTDDLASLMLGAGGPGLILGIIGLVLGSFGVAAVFFSIAIATAIVTAADLWLFHRLVCIAPKKCAIGIVEATPTDGGLGNFDNDQYFDLVLMPHRREDLPVKPDQAPTNFPVLLQPLINEIQKEIDFLDAQPNNYVLQDKFMGEELLLRDITKTLDLPYDKEIYSDPDETKPIKPATNWMEAVLGQLPLNKKKENQKKQFRTSLHENKWLHCEAEGDFWVKMKIFAGLIGAIIGTAMAVAIPAAISTAFTIGAAMCALGPILCLIGFLLALLAAIIILAIAAIAAGLASAAIAAIIFEVGKGDVQDYNVGDDKLKPIKEGDKVAVLGELIYDGFHEGWNEFHPMIAVMHIKENNDGQYLQWNPNIQDGEALPDEQADWPNDIKGLTHKDIRMGLNSEKMLKRAKFLRNKWCAAINDAYDETVKKRQLEAHNRWTIHPLIDSCEPKEEPIVPH
jgi:hypothetical protein